MTKICLVHLVRKKNGITPFRSFLKSYNDNPAGVPHDLLIIFKGFEKNETSEYDDLLFEIPHDTCFVPDIGFDITPYFYTVRNFDYPYYVFLNSFSTILCEDWLLKMYEYARKDDVGIVGATASWESLSREATSLGFFKDMIVYAQQFSTRRNHPPYPNHHLRSNAFMASRKILQGLRVFPILTKADACRFESGRDNLTLQVFAMNKRVLVIGRDGRGYEKEDWPSSDTFRQNNQFNLLVADNQTGAYLAADNALRRKLSIAAWGKASNFY